MRNKKINISIVDTENLGDDIDYTPFTCLASDYGGTCTLYRNIEDKDIFSYCMSSHILITNRIQFSRERLEKLKNLKLIAMTATGFNSVDISAARALNIGVANVPYYSTESVTQFTFSVVLYLIGNIGFYDSFVKNRIYSKEKASSCLERSWHQLNNLTWGIIGMGNIGRRVAHIAEMFGSRIIYYSTSGKNSSVPYTQLPLLQLLSESDIISIHAPLNKNTFSLLNEKTLRYVKRNAILVNVGRGGIVDETVIADLINTDCIGGVAIDVFDREPLHSDNPLLSVKYPDRLLLTPHIAWSSVEARRKLMQVVYSNVVSFLEGRNENRVC